MRGFLPSGCEAEEEIDGRLRGLEGGGDDILKGFGGYVTEY
jgi:hypothetical protein